MRCSEFLYPASIARCQHIKVNGTQCGSPSLKKRKFCYFHQQWQQGRIQLGANRARRARYSLDLPILEDANSIQVALMQAMRLLLTQQVDHKTAALLFYGLQTASTNLRNTNFEPAPERVVIDPRRVSDTALGDAAWYNAEFPDPENEEEEVAEEVETRAGKKPGKSAGKQDTRPNPPETVNLQAVACPNSTAAEAAKRLTHQVKFNNSLWNTRFRNSRPQGLKPACLWRLVARLKPCPSHKICREHLENAFPRSRRCVWGRGPSTAQKLHFVNFPLRSGGQGWVARVDLRGVGHALGGLQDGEGRLQSCATVGRRSATASVL
jgi:hypothetical protein